MKNVVLIGYRCTGKTSVGKKLSEKLRRPFVDTDDLIVDQAGMTVEQIVKEGGWPLFRGWEKDIIQKISLSEGIIIATGGGAMEDRDNRAAMMKKGLFVWLTADPETIISRMRYDRNSETQRPSLSECDLNTEVIMTIEKRAPVYRELAHLTIDTAEKGVDSIVDEICGFLSSEVGLGHQGLSR